MDMIGKNIKKLRLSRGMTQQQLADVVGARTYTTITKWEKGDNVPQGKDLIVLSNYFKVSVDSILGIGKKPEITISSIYPYLPLSISAGAPLEVDALTNDDVDTIEIPDVMMGKWAGSEDVYIMRINGESMNSIMQHGSLIAVKPVELEELSNNDIVVYSNCGDYSVKRFYNDEERQRLIFRPDSDDQVFTDHIVAYEDAGDVKIHGRVVMYIVELD